MSYSSYFFLSKIVFFKNQYLEIFRSKMTFDNVLLEPTLNTVKGLMIMDNNGVRILSKYYDPEIFPNVAAQKKFEKTLFQVSTVQLSVQFNPKFLLLSKLICCRKLTKPMLR